MNRNLSTSLLGLTSVAIGASTYVATLVSGHAAMAAHTTPVLVELFTSEGCSDCPPADKVLSQLQSLQPVRGVDVIALGEHVDYWNNTKWADPYSSHIFSDRQNHYADKFGPNDVYTPQMVVNGVSQFVGSDSTQAFNSIKQASQTPTASVEITSTGEGSTSAGLHITVGRLPSSAGSGSTKVLVAITEDGLTSHVKGGENGGRTLHHVAVVRELTIAGVCSPSGATFDINMPLSGSWQRNKLRAVAFVQENGNGPIVGADETTLR